MRASAGAGVTMGFMDVPNSVKEFELAAEAMARGVRYFLDLAARCFFYISFLDKHRLLLLLLAHLENYRLERSKES
jgi:hypothetical protein